MVRPFGETAKTSEGKVKVPVLLDVKFGELGKSVWREGGVSP